MAEDHRLYALTELGAVRLKAEGQGTDFYAVYHGLYDGVYEAARTYSGKRVYGFDRHQCRMLAGCQAMGMEPSLNEQQLRVALQQALNEFPGPMVKLRWDACPKPYDRLHTEARMIASLTPLPVLADWIAEEGVHLRTTQELVRSDPSTKGSRFAVERGRIPFGTRENYEHLLVSEEGHLLEGAMSNFGAFVGDTLYASTQKALPGITIETLTELAQQHKVEMVREPLHRSQLGTVDEAFLCSSVRGLIPVTRIDDLPIGNGKVGSRFTQLRGWYQDYADASAQRLI